MHKTYILDTNVILHDPQSIFKFEEHTVVIPMTVIEEVDTFKKNMNELGRNARYFSKLMDELREAGSLLEGVKLNSSNGKIRVDLLGDEAYVNLPRDLDLSIADNRILAAAYLIKGSVIVSKDTNMRIKADSLGIPAETYENDVVDFSSLYSGILTTEEGFLPPLDILSPNQFVQVKDANGDVMSEFTYKNGELQHLREDLEAWGLKPRNAEQRYAMQLLLDDDIKLVTLVGQAGTGKTALAVSAGLRKVTDEFIYRKLLISKPVIPMGRDIGYLPGSALEKLNPYMQSIYDNIEFLMYGYTSSSDQEASKSRKKSKKEYSEKDDGILSKGYQELLTAGILEVEPLMYIRGRSIPKQFMLVDEVQNLTPHEVKTIITRAGEDTKIVFTGDPCFVGKQHIITEEGRRSIFSLVNDFNANKPLPKALSYNDSSKTMEFKNITNAFYTGKKELVEIYYHNTKTKCTPNHPFLTTKGYKKAEDLEKGDVLIGNSYLPKSMSFIPTDEQLQVIIGSFLGDGSLKELSNKVFRLNIGHSEKQKEYLLWKAELFNQNTINTYTSKKSQNLTYSFSSKSFIIEQTVPTTKTYVPQWMIDKIDARAIAIWFMDDGTVDEPHRNSGEIFTCSFDEDSNNRLCKKLNELGITCNVKKHKNKYLCINIKKEGFTVLSKLISPYVHKSMAYKIAYKDQDTLGTYQWERFNCNSLGAIICKSVTKLHKEAKVYDITVEDNHNFVICYSLDRNEKVIPGVVVHNCQIDNPYLDASSNGLTYVVEKFKSQPIAGHATLTQGERSELASIAAEIL